MKSGLAAGSDFPGVLDRPPHEQPPGYVEEGQAASRGLLAEPADDGVEVGLAPLDALAVHLGGASVAGAVGAGGDPDPSQEGLEFSAGAVGGWFNALRLVNQTHRRAAHPRHARPRRINTATRTKTGITRKRAIHWLSKIML